MQNVKILYLRSCVGSVTYSGSTSYMLDRSCTLKAGIVQLKKMWVLAIKL